MYLRYSLRYCNLEMPLYYQNLSGPVLRQRNTLISQFSVLSQHNISQNTRLYCIDPLGYFADAIYSPTSNPQWTPGNLRSAVIKPPEGAKFVACDWTPTKTWRGSNDTFLFHHIFYQDAKGLVMQISLSLAPPNVVRMGPIVAREFGVA